MNILLVNPGRRNYFVKYFLDMSKKLKFKLYLIDPNKNIPSFKVSKKTKNFICPNVKNKKIFLRYLRNFIKKKKIKIVFPFSEHEAEILSLEKEYYKKKGVKVIISDYKVIRICRDKIKTNKFLNQIKIATPRLIDFEKVGNNLPIIIKKRFGSGSKHQFIIRDKRLKILKNDKSFVYQKLYKYQEYGMDILNDLKGNFLHTTVKKKLAMRSGDTDRAKLMNPKFFLRIAKKLSLNLKHVGNLDVDFLLNKKKVIVLDLNPRFGGGYPFSHEYGYNYIETLINLAQNKKIKKFKNFSNKNNLFSKGITIHQH